MRPLPIFYGCLRSGTLRIGSTSCKRYAVHQLNLSNLRYAVHQLNLWPRVSLPESSPTLHWTGKVGDASVFRVWGSRAFVRDTSADKLSARAFLCVFLGFSPDAPGWQFHHPTSHRVFPSQDVTPPPIDPLPPQGPVPSGVSRVDPLRGTAPVGVAVGSRAARGAESGGTASGGAEPEGVEPGGPESEGAESGGAEPRGNASSGGPAGASPRLSPLPEPLSPQQLREWFAQRTCLRSGAAGAGDSAAGDIGAGGAGVTAGAGGTGGAAAAGPGGACTRGSGAARTGGVGGAGAGDPTEPGAAGAGGAGVVGAGAGDTGAGGAGAAGAGAVDPGAGGAGGTVRPRPYFVPLLQQVLGVPSSPGLTPPLLCPPPDESQPLLQPASALPGPSPYTQQVNGLTERRVPPSCPASPICTGRRVPRPRPPPVPGTHAMALCPSFVPLCVPLPAPPESSLPAIPDPESDGARVASPTVSRLLATVVSDPSFESTVASALVAELVDFAAAYRLDTPVLTWPTPLSTSYLLSAPPSDESVEPSGLYPELVGCLMYLMTCTQPDLAYPLSLLACYVAPGRHRKVHWDGAKRVLRYLCSTLGIGLVLGGRGPVVLTGHAEASWVDESTTQWSSQGYTFSLGSGSVSWRSTRSSSVLSSGCEAEIYAGAMAAQELRWLTYLLTELGEQPHSPPVLYVDNKAMIVLCQEHRLEHRTMHITLRYFLARELQQRGQLHFAYVATRANTADIFTKALPPTCFAFLDWSCDHLFSPIFPMGCRAALQLLALPPPPPPAHRALLPCVSRHATASALRPTAASASRSAALRIAPCCS
ncbi:unnamed protein product [Closterium sp. NIES-53]